MKKNQLWVIALILFLSSPLLAEKPNIVLIMADDLGYECISANGGTSYQTPNLDRLAKTGIRFTHCYSQPLCTPSRVQLMTGIYNVRNYERFGLLPPSETTFGNLLEKNGYETCVIGKWQLEGNPKQFGFQKHCLWHINGRFERYPNPGVQIDGKMTKFSNGEYGPDVVSDYACKFIEDNKDKPFFVYYPMILTHCPFWPTPDSADWDPKSKGSPTYKGKPEYFGDMVKYMDKVIGKIVNQLDKSGVRENTLVMFIGDNGTDAPIVSKMNGRPIKGEKGKMNDGGTRVPFIANWPKTIPSEQVSNDLVDFSDFMPTICSITNTKIPEKLAIDGRSFFPQLKGEKGNPREWIYCWYARDGGKQGKQWTRNQRYKLYPNGNFFDIKNDPNEKSPLMKSELNESQQLVASMLKKALSKFENARPDSVAEVGEKLRRQKQEKRKQKKQQQKNQAKQQKKKKSTKGK